MRRVALHRLGLDHAAAPAIAERDVEPRPATPDRLGQARLHEIGARRIAVERFGVEAVRAGGEDRLGGVERERREMRGPELHEAQPANASAGVLRMSPITGSPTPMAPR